MPIRDAELQRKLQKQLQFQLRYLVKLTRSNVLKWKRTAHLNETFSAPMVGLFVATVWEDTLRKYFKMANIEGQILVTASSVDSDLVDALFAEAKKRAFSLDKVIPSIFKRVS